MKIKLLNTAKPNHYDWVHLVPNDRMQHAATPTKPWAPYISPWSAKL
jgi:hypothetical protein